MPIVSRLATLCLFMVSSLAIGQSTTQEDLGTVTAPVMASGLGWQVHSNNEQEFAAIAAAGATHVRMDSCVWSATEQQSAPPNNVSTGYTLPSACVSGLTFAKKYGLKPTVIAAFGGPYHQILTVTVASAAAAGATSIAVEYSSGVGGNTLSSIAYPYAYLAATDGSRVSKKFSYSGDLITGVSLTSGTTGTINLASGLTSAISAGTSLWVNQLLYPSAVTGDPTSPSIVAYSNYAQFLARQIKAYGLTGDVEIWNEPPWGEDCWDNRHDCYDTDPALPNELPGNEPNFGLPIALQSTTPVAGVTYVWAGTNKSAGGDLLNSNALKFSGQSFDQSQNAVTAESMHPYGSNPEDAMWNLPCLVANPKGGTNCDVIPANQANFVFAAANNVIAQEAGPNYGINHVVTETGAATTYMPTDHMARFDMRQYLGFMASGMSYVEFYRLFDLNVPSAAGFGFITLPDNNAPFTPLANYTALAGLMSDFTLMSGAPVTSYSESSLPSVGSYVGGTYNLDHMTIVGSRQGDKSNSMMYVLFQRSYSPYGCSNVQCWGTLASPAEALTTVTIPSGLKIQQAVNLDTRAAVTYTQSGSVVTLYVSDDPIELLLIPSTDTTAISKAPKLIFANIAAQIQGASVEVSASSESNGIITYSVVSGPATSSGPMVTATGPGTVILKATQAAKGEFTAASASASFSVSATTPALGFIPISSKLFGNVFTVSASSHSKGAVTYSVVSGPARVSGSTVTTTGAGTVVLEATQAANGAYTGTTATTSFTVLPISPTFTFTSIPAHIFGDIVNVSATTNSSGAITYSVVSGPATISGSTVTTTNYGEVVLQASLAALGNYRSATATTQFYVSPAVPVLAFDSISAKPYNSVFTIKASSASSGSIIYSVVSGPARLSNGTVTTSATAGTVVLKAYQSVSGAYTSASTTISFSVAASVTPTLSFANVSTQTVGSVFNVSATSASPGAVTYSVASGPATISGSTVTVTGAGTIVLHASQAASGGYNAASASTTITVAANSLAFTSVPSKHFGDVFSVSASSASPAAITYSVLSGPATIAGSTVTATGIGTVVLGASQAASGQYSAATATTSFSVAAQVAALSFVGITPKTFGDTWGIKASSASSGDVVYSVESGPAVVSGVTATVNGVGTVVLKATQAASGNYAAATTTISFPVVADPRPLKFIGITPKTVGAVFGVLAQALSPGSISYSVVSGPATISQSTVTMTGPGTVVLKATQAAVGVWPMATTTISFPVVSQ